jgi:hypothetical protein
MGFWRDFLFGEKDKKPMLVTLPTPLVFATETVVYLRNTKGDEEVTFDDIVQIALEQYLRKNLWTTTEEGTVTKINRDYPSSQREQYTNGRKQVRN